MNPIERAVFLGWLRPWPKQAYWPECQHCGLGVGQRGARIVVVGDARDQKARCYVWHSGCMKLQPWYFVE